MASPADQMQLEGGRAAVAVPSSDTTAGWLKTQQELPGAKHEEAWRRAKIIMRAVALVVSITGLVVIGGIGRDLMVLPLTILCTVWNSTEFVTMGIRRSLRRGVTVKAHVGADLLLWIYSVVLFVDSCRSINSALAREPSINSTWMGVAMAILMMLTALHAALFVRACVEIDRQNKSRRIQKLVTALQRLGRNRSEAPLPTEVLPAPETALPKSSALTDWMEASPSPRGEARVVYPPAAVDPRGLNAKYNPEAMMLVRELDVQEGHKVLGSMRAIER